MIENSMQHNPQSTSLAGHKRTSYQTAVPWNTLPVVLKLTKGGVIFKVALRKHLLRSRDQLTKKLKSLNFNTKIYLTYCSKSIQIAS